jgi:predicted NBD/HSP70 family sugar kinase
MRQINRSILMNLIKLHEPVSRAQLAELTGMFRSTVSEIVKELVSLGLVLETVGQPRGRGRVPVLLSLNNRSFWVIGVCVRPERTDVALAGLSGKKERSISFPTPARPNQLLSRLSGAINQLRDQPGCTNPLDIYRIGVGVPGRVDAAAGRMLGPAHLPAYANFNMVAALEERFGIQTEIQNDARLGALAEASIEAAEQKDSGEFVFVQIAPEGVGGGIVIDGELYNGHHETLAGEFGHMVVEANGPQCACGRRGCWELYVSDRATVRRYAPQSDPTDPQNREKFWEAVSKREPAAVKCLKETARYIGIGLGNIVCTLDPASMVIAGRVCKEWDIVFPIIDRAFAPAHLTIPVRKARLDTDDLYLQGTILLAVNAAFRQPEVGINVLAPAV